MYLLYLDDSGSVGNVEDRHVILAGLAVFERRVHWLSKSLDEIAERVWPADPGNLEFRGADILGGKKQWRGIGKDARLSAYQDALNVLGRSKHVRLFGAAVHKATTSPNEPMEYAFEQVCSRFDMFLGRLHNDCIPHISFADNSSIDSEGSWASSGSSSGDGYDATQYTAYNADTG